jgi:hypothetical protein
MHKKVRKISDSDLQVRVSFTTDYTDYTGNTLRIIICPILRIGPLQDCKSKNLLLIRLFQLRFEMNAPVSAA